ncbi:MAG: SurA N-terminal domain-containing protein [Syntrophaceticus sp.]
MNSVADSAKKGFKYLPQVLVFILIVALGFIWIWWVYHGDWVVQVNGYKISEKDLDQEAAYLQIMQESQGMDFQGDQGKMLKAQLRQIALNQLVDRALMCQAARQSGIKVDKAEIENQILITQLQAGGAENFQKMLAAQGMTEAGYKKLLEESMMLEQLWEQVTKDTVVEEDEIRRAYQELKDLLIFPERVKVGHILVKTEEDAREVIAELKEGADFQELAVKKSTDPTVKQNKGILDDISKDSSVAEEFKAEAFRLSPGEFSQEPVKTEFGYHVLWCFEKKDAGQASYEDVKDLLEQQLLNEKKQEQFMHYLDGLRKAGRIMYHPKNSVIPD